MSRRTNLTLLVILSVAFGVAALAQQQTTDREQDGLLGPVRRVKTETAKMTVKSGKPLEGPRVLLETTTYDNKGAKVDNAYFLAAGGSLTGKEVYKYDERGNIVEMTLTGEDGTLQAKETYTYEFDAFGNWTKMTTNVAMIEGGKVSYEPTEVSYRSIAYYLDEATIAKMSQPAAQPAAPAATNPASTAPPSTAPANTTPAGAANVKATPTLNQPAAPTTNSAAKKETVAAAAAPLNIAASDRPAGAVAPANLSASLNTGNAAAATSGPVVKVEGEAPAAAPPRPVRSGPLKPVSGGILNGKALNMPAPIYPDLARRARVGGTVDVEVVIDLTGKVVSAKAVKGPALLHAAAEQAARYAKFSPTLLSGQPVRISGTITYNFNLSQ